MTYFAWEEEADLLTWCFGSQVCSPLSAFSHMPQHWLALLLEEMHHVPQRESRETSEQKGWLMIFRLASSASSKGFPNALEIFPQVVISTMWQWRFCLGNPLPTGAIHHSRAGPRDWFRTVSQLHRPMLASFRTGFARIAVWEPWDKVGCCWSH